MIKKFRIDILTALPDSIDCFLNSSIIRKAKEKNKVHIEVHNLRNYAFNKYKQIDDKPFGGFPGMLLKPEPFFECIGMLQSERTYDYVIYTSPGGIIYDQKLANKLSLAENIIIIAGHYKGIDDRVRTELSNLEISIGNFVLSGGELPALLITDSIVRLIPGVLGDSESALNDSFMDGEIIDSPYYTRPAEYKNIKVPEVLLSGDTKRINVWKEEQSKLLTKQWKKYNGME